MLTILLILGLLVAVLAVIFALQNTAAITVTFLFWQFNQSLALVLLLAVFAGVLIGLLTILPGAIRNQWRTSGQKKKIDSLEKSAAELKIRAEEAERKLAEKTAELAGKPSAPTAQTPPVQPEKPAENTLNIPPIT